MSEKLIKQLESPSGHKLALIFENKTEGTKTEYHVSLHLDEQEMAEETSYFDDLEAAIDHANDWLAI